MASSTTIGSSIEGEKVGIQTRQFYPYPPKKDIKTKALQFGFKLGIRGDAEIIEGYANPLQVCSLETSMFCTGDKIAGQSIYGWAKKSLGKPNVSRGSGTHSASFLSISGGCFATVEISPREHLQSEDIQKRHPQVIQVPRKIS
jgi:hypothetical protein